MGWIARGFRIEALVLGILILLALLVEFRRGTPWLRMMWGCLGALAGLAVFGVSSPSTTILPGLLLAYVAGSLARISQCAMERRLLLTGAKPVQQLSLRLVAARAGHGGNDMD